MGGKLKGTNVYEAIEKHWKSLRKLANSDGDGVLYWRVEGKGERDKRV